MQCGHVIGFYRQQRSRKGIAGCESRTELLGIPLLQHHYPYGCYMDWKEILERVWRERNLITLLLRERASFLRIEFTFTCFGVYETLDNEGLWKRADEALICWIGA